MSHHAEYKRRAFHGTYCSFAIYRMVPHHIIIIENTIPHDPCAFSCGRILSKIWLAHCRYHMMETINYNILRFFFLKKKINERTLRRDCKHSRDVLFNKNNKSATRSEEEFVITLIICCGHTQCLLRSNRICGLNKDIVMRELPSCTTEITCELLLSSDFTDKTEVSKSKHRLTQEINKPVPHNPVGWVGGGGGGGGGAC
jgi:hypothetical protein